MSGKICRETYSNYGSYLRSRGYDKAICDLIDMIESGKIPVGPFHPIDNCNAHLNGTLEITECDGNMPGPGTGGIQTGMGQLWIQGGYGGDMAMENVGSFAKSHVIPVESRGIHPFVKRYCPQRHSCRR